MVVRNHEVQTNLCDFYEKSVNVFVMKGKRKNELTIFFYLVSFLFDYTFIRLNGRES